MASFKFKPIYMWGWSNEGILYRKGRWVVVAPSEGKKMWKLRKVGSGNGIQAGEREMNSYDKKEVFKFGNLNIKEDRKTKKSR